MPDLNHAKRLQWLAERETECPGDGVIPPNSGFRIDHSMGHCTRCDDTGKVSKFPSLRQPCPNYNAVANYKEGSGWTLAACEEYQAFCRSGQDACHGRGWVVANSLEASLEASCYDNVVALKVLEAIKVALFEDGEMSRYNQAAVDTLYEAVKAEVKGG